MISVIVPIYNVKMYLEKCLSSLAAQTYKDLEVVLIDDGSTDGSDVICKQFTEQNSNFRYFRQENKGISAARNAGIEQAHGKFLAFVDADDWVEADMFEVLYRVIHETNADISACHYIVEKDGEIIQSFEASGEVEVFSPQNKYKELLFSWKRYCGVNVWGKLFRRELLTEIRFPEYATVGEDAVFMCELLPHVKEYAYCWFCKYHYTQRSTSLTHASFRPSFWTIQKSARKVIELTKNYYPDAVPLAQMRAINENLSLVLKLCAVKQMTRENYRRVKREIKPCVNRHSMKLLSRRRRIATRLFLTSRRLFLFAYKLIGKGK